MGGIKGSRMFSKQLNHDMYKEYTHHYLREVSTDPPDEVTEILSELDTTEGLATGSIAGGAPVTGEMMSTTPELVFETASSIPEYTTIEDAITSQYETDAPSESSQTILIVLGILLAVLVIVCCVLACIFAKMRRKGFCTVEGKNQATCDDDCQLENGMSLQQSPKESMSSGKSENSRSSDKLLTK